MRNRTNTRIDEIKKERFSTEKDSQDPCIKNGKKTKKYRKC